MAHLPVEGLEINAAASVRDFGPPLDRSLKRRTLFCARYGLAVLMGLNNVNFFMKIKFNKKAD